MNRIFASLVALLLSQQCVAKQWIIEHKVEPNYPLHAINQQKQGCTVLQYFINSTGNPVNIEVLASHPVGFFERSAITALSSWQYSPSATNPQRTPARQSIRFNFNEDNGLAVLNQHCNDIQLTNEPSNLDDFNSQRLVMKVDATDLETLEQSINKITLVLPQHKHDALLAKVAAVQRHYDLSDNDERYQFLSRFHQMNYFQILALSSHAPRQFASLLTLSVPNASDVALKKFRYAAKYIAYQDMGISMPQHLYRQISDKLLAIELLVNKNSVSLISTCREINPDIFNELQLSVDSWELISDSTPPKPFRFIFGVPTQRNSQHYHCDPSWYPKHVNRLGA